MARGFLHGRLSYAYRHPKPFIFSDIEANLSPPKEDIATDFLEVVVAPSARFLGMYHRQRTLVCAVAPPHSVAQEVATAAARRDPEDRAATQPSRMAEISEATGDPEVSA